VNTQTETGHSVLDIAYQTRELLERWLSELTADGPIDENAEIADPSSIWDSIRVRHTSVKIGGVTIHIPEDPEVTSEPSVEVGAADQDEVSKAGSDSGDIEEQERECYFDAPGELEMWHSSIKKLEQKGAKRARADVFPRGLLSLTPLDQENRNTYQIRTFDVRDSGALD